MKEKVGLIALGNRDDFDKWDDVVSLLAPEIEVETAGVLDGLTEEEIAEQFAFMPGENYLVTGMPWGSEVHISEEKANAVVYRLACELFDRGNRTVLVLCTGDFDRPAVKGHLFLLPEDLMFGILQGLRQKKLGFIVPEPGQIPSSLRQYQALNPVIHAASPYGPMEELARAADAFRDEDVEIVVTDCMGFTAPMGRMVAEHSGKQVLVPRLVIPKLLKALLLQQ